LRPEETVERLIDTEDQKNKEVTLSFLKSIKIISPLNDLGKESDSKVLSMYKSDRGLVYIRLSDFVDFIEDHTGEIPLPKVAGRMLRSLGVQYQTVTLSLSNGVRSSRSMWFVPTRLVDRLKSGEV